MCSQWGMCAASHFCLRWVWPAGQSSCSPMLLVCFHAHVQLFQIFTPWGQCWNCVHLLSLHTRQELTLAFICAAGQWASLTETFRPLRWLLSFLSLYHSLRLLVLCQLQPDLPFSPYFNLHFCLGLSRFSLLLLVIRLSISSAPPHSSLVWDGLHCQKTTTKLVVSKSSVFPAEHLCVCACAYDWLSRVKDKTVICFPITACDPKTTREVQSIAGSMPAVGKEWLPRQFNFIASS